MDTLIVGKWIGAEALALVGSACTRMAFITSTIIGPCMGSGAFFPTDYGAGLVRSGRIFHRVNPRISAPPSA